MTLASDALAIARAGIRGVDPRGRVAGVIQAMPGGVRIGGRRLALVDGASVRPVAVGKAAAAMVDAALDALGPHAGPAIAVIRAGNPRPSDPVEVLESDHPVPTERSVAAGERLLANVAALAPDDVALFLLSGGTSALLEAPADGLELADLARTNEVLLASGRPIQEMNAVRRHLSRVKGGQLAAATSCRRWVTLALSDVVGDTPEDVGSGPTVGDPTSFRETLRLVERHGLLAQLPPPVARRLRAGAAGRVPENPRPGDPRLRGGSFRFIATNRTAVAAAAVEARRRGYRVRRWLGPIVGETAPAAQRFARALRNLPPGPPDRCLIGGGETTVTMGRVHGKGGRNQEFALVAADVLAGVPLVGLISLGTDGVDGPTDAAGGLVDGATADRLRTAGIDPDRALARHDAYPALDRVGALLRIGPTGTNVTDLHVGVSGARSRTGRSSRPSAPDARPRRRS